MSRRVKITIFLLLVFCLALAGHLVWCLVYHIYGESAALRNEQNCFLCGNVESSCTCKSIDDFNALQDQLNAQNEEATTQIEALNRELELYKEEVANLKLQIQALEAQIPTEDGLCHKACSVHCPECQHPYTVEVRSEETTVIVGTSSTCKKITCVVKTVCGECGAVLDTKTEVVEIDNSHSYGNDTECDDCGYVKPVVKPTVTSTAVPTAEPTAVPTAEPTAVPTAEPTAVPTAEPTAVPTAEPTAVPTAEPTAVPTAEPTAVPTAEPTAVPTAEPTAVPTAEPTAVPTAEPTAAPTATPTPTPCPHDNQRSEYTEWTDDEMVGTEDKCHTEKRIGTTYCNDCGIKLTSWTEWRDVADHTYKGRKCTVCRYVEPPVADWGEATDTIPPNNNEWEYDDESGEATPASTADSGEVESEGIRGESSTSEGGENAGSNEFEYDDESGEAAPV